MEVVFSRGTLTPEQQKKVPFTRTQEEAHKVDGDDGIHPFDITVGSSKLACVSTFSVLILHLLTLQTTQPCSTVMSQSIVQLTSWRKMP